MPDSRSAARRRQQVRHHLPVCVWGSAQATTGARACVHVLYAGVWLGGWYVCVCVHGWVGEREYIGSTGTGVLLILGHGVMLRPVLCLRVASLQVRALKAGVSVVVGTPGRMEDLMQEGCLKLNVSAAH